MIKELEISNLAVIEEAKLPFLSSYVALVGETGAGKSLIVNSFSLLEGERADFSLLRDKSKKAIVFAKFQIDENYRTKNPEITPYVDKNGFCTVQRVLNPDKSSRCYLNDEPVSVNELKTVTSHLIDIHSQNQRNDILDEQRQLQYLDIFGGDEIAKVKDDFTKKYHTYLEKYNEYQQLLHDNAENDRDYLRFQIDEIEKYNLKEHEIEDLNEEFESLKDLARLQDHYQEFSKALHGNALSLDDELSLVSNALRAFSSSPLTVEAEECMEEIRSLQISLQTLQEKYESLSLNPQRIDEINERLFSLKSLQRKYGKSTAEILAKWKDYKEKLSRIDTYEERKEELQNALNQSKQEALQAAEILHETRVRFGQQLGAAISKEAADLGLRKNAVSVSLTLVDLYEEGIDHCSFVVQLNAGIDKASLAKAASGGEASRLMLALKVVLNRLNPYDLMILDEIDTGISGKQALLVAEKIKSISCDSQIFVISHLPQVVASADSALEIRKEIDEKNNITFSKTKLLSEEEMIQVVAKMLSGSKLTEAAIHQAEELRKETTEKR